MPKFFFLLAPEFFANSFFFGLTFHVFFFTNVFFCFVTLLIHGLLRSSSAFLCFFTFLFSTVFFCSGFFGFFLNFPFPLLDPHSHTRASSFSSSVYKYINLGLFFFVLR
uniref:(northern house mosquito) hypothetical protein n=1 Tax=Culex pipiens TaxID=7175 RepID=A0A8D8GV65_CULPI